MDEDAGGVAELMALAAETLFLQVAELVERFLELAGEAGAVEREFGELVDDGSGGVFGRQDGGGGGEAVAERVEGGAVFAGCGAGTGGVMGVGAIGGSAASG